MIPNLKINPSNPRIIKKKQYERLLKSLESFTKMLELRPIIYDEDGVIWGGNMRYQALMQLHNDGKVEIKDEYFKQILGYTEEEKKEFAIRDNVELGDWDMDSLANEWSDLPLEEWGIDLSGWGTEVEEDDAPEVSKEEPVSKLGEVYQLGRHRLMCGDSTKIEDVEKLMNGQKADMVFTDPPYGINVVKNDMVGANFGVANKGKYSPVINDETTQTAQDAYNLFVTFDIPKIILWGGNYFLSFLPPSDGWLIWDKRGDTGIKNTFADGEMAWCNFHTPVRIYKQLWNGMIREGEHDKRVHPTQKPIVTLSQIIKDFSEDNNLILDTFGGSGSTLIACEQLNRTCYMMELDPKYCDVIRKRYAKFIGEEDWQEI